MAVRALWRPLLLLLCLVPTLAWAEPPVFLGLYPGGPLTTQIPHAQAVDAWTGKVSAMLGTFADPEIEQAVVAELEAAWARGSLPFLNLMTMRTSQDVAAGGLDGPLRAWADAIAVWARDGKRLFLAPLPEMNGTWTPYYGSPSAFKLAWARVQDLFAEALVARGVSHTAISWVYAPNGWSLPGDTFEVFYPGHEAVDVVGISSFNVGTCGGTWQDYAALFPAYLTRARTMAPGKPILIAQTGTTSAGGDKNAWLRSVYSQLAAVPRLRGVLYFDYDAPCDFTVSGWPGYRDAAANPAYGYWAPWSPEVGQTVFAPTVPHVYTDVHPVHPWGKEDGEVDYSPWIHALAAAGITSPCLPDLTRFCPTDAVTRTQMAPFLERAMRGGAYQPPPAIGTLFADVTVTTPSAAWIEQLWRDGITAGCAVNPLRYCPTPAVTRAEMAVFVLRAKYGAGYIPPPATGTRFTDVPQAAWFARWVEQLAREGITAGCSATTYCPQAPVLRQQIAVFLVRARGLAF